jgi:hypothetical protein
MAKPLLYFHSVRFLKAGQIYFRLYYLLRKKIRKAVGHSYDYSVPGTGGYLELAETIPHTEAYSANRFMFLNRAKEFKEIDWEFSEFGKLWCYNLNYFAYLLQNSMTVEEGLALVRHFIENVRKNKTALEPYPTSLRITNWIKFLSKHGIRDDRIDHSLYAQALILNDNIEYHLMGNHLLENGCALLFAGCFFRDEYLYKKAEHLLLQELNEQILPDGGHFELSPMYHMIILERVLDCVNLLKHNNPFDGRNLRHDLEEKAALMLGWLKQVIFENGDMPLVNDSANGIAPSAPELFSYAGRLGIKENGCPLKESGYRKVKKGDYEAFIDAGNICPDYMTGHAHSDTFNFMLYLKCSPFIVDTGVSTYENSALRLRQRGTSAHNTVQVGDYEQSEVWESFRVARRAHVTELSEDENTISAAHDGYGRIGVLHKRAWQFSDNAVIITDEIISKRDYPCYAFFHFYPCVTIHGGGNSVTADGHAIKFYGCEGFQIKGYDYAPEFNRLEPAEMIIVTFNRKLQTEIIL